jgi:tryptophan 2,3-dioxygenase
VTEPQPAGGTDYARYLLIDDLLDLQRPLTPEAHDELLFIVVHQAYELWFKLILHELELAREELENGRAQAALGPLLRVLATERVLMAQLDVLETMGPEGFMEFRDPLAPASGFQSRQFREIERLSGEPMWRAFCAAGERLGLRFPGDLRDLYVDHADDPARGILYQVAERLLDHDENVARWRFGHVLMASREIGSRPGTGGSRGVEYLRGTLDRRFYPDLWEVRNLL